MNLCKKYGVKSTIQLRKWILKYHGLRVTYGMVQLTGLSAKKALRRIVFNLSISDSKAMIKPT